MDGLMLLRDARRAGLDVAEDAGCLVVRGPRRLEPVARRLLVDKAQVLAALAAERSAVGWRVRAMQTMVPSSGSIPLLLARPGLRFAPGSCCSCGDPLAPDDRYRCRPCVEAAVAVLESLR